MTNKQMMWCIAAAIAAGGVMEPDAFAQSQCTTGLGECEELEVPVQFSPQAQMTREGYLKTSGQYAVRIDQVIMNPCNLTLSTEDLSIDGEQVSVEPSGQSMRLAGVCMKGRVFDLRGDRLPGEGLVIEGQLPVDVLVKKSRRVNAQQPWRSEEVVAVDYELPTHFFDDVDWCQLKGE